MFGVLRVGLDCDWDRLQTYANQMSDVREMLGLDRVSDADRQFERQTLFDYISLLAPAILREVNLRVVATGHGVARKKPGAPFPCTGALIQSWWNSTFGVPPSESVLEHGLHGPACDRLVCSVDANTAIGA